MTEIEFDVLDELYFVISFKDLQEVLNMDESELIEELKGIFEKGWLRVFSSPDGTADLVKISNSILLNTFLLASKAGLKAHNS